MLGLAQNSTPPASPLTEAAQREALRLIELQQQKQRQEQEQQLRPSVESAPVQPAAREGGAPNEGEPQQEPEQPSAPAVTPAVPASSRPEPSAAPPSSSGAAAPAAALPCFALRSVTIAIAGAQGAGQALPDQWLWLLKESRARLQDQCLDAIALANAIGALQQLLQSRGYPATRLLLPEQSLTTGTLMLWLQEGRIRRITGKDTDGRLRLAWVLPLRLGEILREEDLLQGQAQLRRITSLAAAQILVRNLSEAPPGTEGSESGVELLVQTQATKPWRLTFNINDAGSSATGKWIGFSSLAWDNLLGLADSASLGYTSDLDAKPTDHYQRSGFFNWSVPFGYWLLTLSGFASGYRQQVVGTYQSFELGGASQGEEVRLARVFNRSGWLSQGAQARIAYSSSRNTLDGVEIEVQRRRVSTAEAGYFLEAADTHNQARLAANVRQGVGWFGAMSDSDIEGRQSGDPTFEYQMWLLDASYARSWDMLGFPWRYFTQASWQHSDSVLYAADMTGIGSRYSVRGFDGKQTLSGTRGGYWRNDLEWAAFSLAGLTSQSLYLGLDAGNVQGKSGVGDSDTRAGDTLSGWALGVRCIVSKWGLWQWDAFAAWPIRKPNNFNTSAWTSGVSLTAVF